MLITPDTILRVALQDMREAMKKQRWSWDEIEAFLGGALGVRGVDIDDILAMLRGNDELPL